MPDASTLLTFLAALLVLEITPGPDMMLVAARGIGQGRRIAALTLVGNIFVAGAVQVALLVLGLASVLAAWPAALALLQWGGAIYLLWLGIRLIRGSHIRRSPGPREAVPVAAKSVPGWIAMRDGAINSLTNPKSLLFMFTVLPMFVNPQAGPVWLQLLVLGSIQKLISVFSLGPVAMASGAVGQWLRRWPGLLAWQERFTGVVMIGLGLRLLLVGGPAPRH